MSVIDSEALLGAAKLGVLAGSLLAALMGLAWGMATQISDDCQDLAEDLANGLHTLPVIEGLSRVYHPRHSLLKKLVGKTDLDGEEIETVLTILEEMESIVDCRRLIRAYQVQATAVFNTLPGLKPFFEA